MMNDTTLISQCQLLAPGLTLGYKNGYIGLLLLIEHFDREHND